MDSHKFRDKQSQTTQTPFDEPLTGMDVSPQLEIYPTAEMTEERKNTLWRVTPFSLVPIPTATAMLLIGSQRYHADCFFPLAQALTISGTISLSLVVMSAVAVAVVGWIFDEPYLTNGTKMLLRGLERLSQFLAFAQVFTHSTCHICRSTNSSHSRSSSSSSWSSPLCGCRISWDTTGSTPTKRTRGHIVHSARLCSRDSSSP